MHPLDALRVEPGPRVDVLLAQLRFHPFHAGPDEDGVAGVDPNALPSLGGLEIGDGHVLVRLIPGDATRRGDVEQHATREDPLPLGVDRSPSGPARRDGFRALAAVV